ncbi:hypothetical protein CQA78_30955, partial [Klebsiella pneumoniae]
YYQPTSAEKKSPACSSNPFLFYSGFLAADVPSQRKAQLMLGYYQPTSAEKKSPACSSNPFLFYSGFLAADVPS